MNSALLDREAIAFYPTERLAPQNRGRAGARVSRGLRMTSADRRNRDSQMIVMRENGATLEEIGAAFSITRERARQLLKRQGYAGAGAFSGPDPIAVMRVVRDPAFTDGVQVASALGIPRQEVARVLTMLGIGAAVNRLFRMRRRALRQAAHITALRAFVAANGRSPTSSEMGTKVGVERAAGLPYAMSLVKDFGSIPAAFAAAGIASRKKGSPGRTAPRKACNRGHAFTPENTYVWNCKRQGPVRLCRICMRARDARSNAVAKARRHAARAALPSPPSPEGT